MTLCPILDPLKLTGPCSARHAVLTVQQFPTHTVLYVLHVLNGTDGARASLLGKRNGSLCAA